MVSFVMFVKFVNVQHAVVIAACRKSFFGEPRRVSE